MFAGPGGSSFPFNGFVVDVSSDPNFFATRTIPYKKHMSAEPVKIYHYYQLLDYQDMLNRCAALG